MLSDWSMRLAIGWIATQNDRRTEIRTSNSINEEVLTLIELIS